MSTNSILIFICLISLPMEFAALKHRRFRRREFVQEEVRKTMLNYMTSIKGEIADVVLDEMVDYYDSQRSKLYHLEKELNNMRHSSLPNATESTMINNLVLRISKQQLSFASNISFMEHKITNLTNILRNLLTDVQQQKPVELVRRLVSNENKPLPTDCDDVFHQRISSIDEGIFRIKPRFASQAFDVKCVFENNTAWTIIQQRRNGTVDFYRGWEEYKNGFGDLQTEFWLGNENIHQLTKQGKYALRIDLKPWDAPSRIAEYGQFALDNAKEHYKLQVSDYQANTSTVGDSLTSSWDNANGASFSTYDHDHDNLFYDNCALTYHGAWWFTACFQSHLNGAYIRSPLALQNSARNGLQWNTYALYHSMKETTMRIRRVKT